MKTLTITLHDTDNCGSSLQSLALQHFLHSNNIENEIINYVPGYVKNNGTRFKTFVRKLIFFRESMARDRKFKSFVRNNLNLTKRTYYSLDELRKNPPLADCYITGSDQLWNSMYMCGNDPAFYLDFIDSNNKLAYAVSLGREEIPLSNLDIIKTYTHGFQWISARERTSVEQLRSVLPEAEIDHVCDPVLLNTVDFYQDIQAPRMISEPYILVYLAQSSDKVLLDSFIKQLKARLDCKVVLIGSYRNRCQCDIHKRDVAPDEFLSLIFNAEYVLSNSFHATLFSLMFEKQFASILPEHNGARISEILEYAGLSEHALNTVTTHLPWISDYSASRKKLSLFREESKEKILRNLEKINHVR